MMNKNSFVTAISLMAVIFIAVSLSGCVTSRHIDELKTEHREIKSTVSESGSKIDKMEELITESADASNKLRNDLSTSNDHIQEQIDALLLNYNELLRMVQQISAQVNSKKVMLGSVPGGTVEQNSATQTTTPTTTPVETMPEKPAVDCGLLYDDAFVMFRAEKYQEAITNFENFIEKCPTHTSVENAHYWVGECYYALEKYVDASARFDFLLKNFKSTVNASRALYKLARCKQELGKKDEAKKIFQRLIDEYPGTLEGSQAKDLIKDL